MTFQCRTRSMAHVGCPGSSAGLLQQGAGCSLSQGPVWPTVPITTLRPPQYSLAPGLQQRPGTAPSMHTLKILVAKHILLPRPHVITIQKQT